MKILPRFRSRINRRAFLRGAGTVAVGLPFLEGMRERSAWGGPGDTGGPPLFGFFICTSCGVVQQNGQDPERFWPTSAGPLTTASMEAFAADRATGLLAPYADRLLMIRGIRYPNNNTGCGHAQGLAQCLTASLPQGSNNTTRATETSADVIIADALNPVGVAPLNLYSGMKGGYIEDMLSFRGSGTSIVVNASESNPFRAYEDLMGFLPAENSGPDLSAAELLAVQRKSVNDLVREELNALRGSPRLSQSDRDRLDLHFQSVRDMEQNMVAMATCSSEAIDITAVQALEQGSAFDDNGVIEEISLLQMQIVGLAFACNATRVATLQIGDGTDATQYTIDGRRLERFHRISHRIDSDGTDGPPIAGALESHIAIDRLRIGTFRAMLDRWSEYQVENGPLLDNAFVLWTNHVASGPNHSFRNLPYIIAGNAGGALRQGEYLQLMDVTNDRVINTLMTAIGVTGADGGPFTNLGARNGGLLDDILI